MDNPIYNGEVFVMENDRLTVDAQTLDFAPGVVPANKLNDEGLWGLRVWRNDDVTTFRICNAVYDGKSLQPTTWTFKAVHHDFNVEYLTVNNA